jgi:peptidoglycan/LPS O-acetylase OafA/YrhL
MSTTTQDVVLESRLTKSEISQVQEPADRLDIVDLLRGLASLAVCWFHLMQDPFIASPPLLLSARYGWLGVDVFFVLSGLVIPLSLARAGYSIGGFFRFVAKRMLRLDPPYLVAIVLVLAKDWLYARYKGELYVVDGVGLVLHLAYINALFQHAWLNPVFWTLAIEFQYYLGMGIVFALVSHQRGSIRLMSMGVLATLAFLVPDYRLLFHYIFLFLLGITVFQRRQGLIGRSGFLFLLGGSFAGCIMTRGVLPAAVGLSTAILIAAVNTRIRGATPLGRISYSLYLVHYPIGLTLMSLVRKALHVAGIDAVGQPAIVPILSLCGCVLVAHLFYFAVEGPAHRWSSQLSYRRHVDTPAVAR